MQSADGCEQAAHQSGSESGLDSGRQPSTTNGAEPSGAACVAPPGQRRNWRSWNSSRRCASGFLVSWLFDSLKRERAEDRLDAGVVAAGVVGRGALAELREPARPGRACSCAACRRTPASGRTCGSRAGSPWRSGCSRRGSFAVRLIRSLFLPGVRISWLQVADRRAGRRPRAGSAARRGCRAPWCWAWTTSTSWSTSSSAARRFTNVVFALRRVVGSRPSAARQRHVLVADRAEGGVGVAHQLGQLAAALGDGADRLGGVDQEALEHRVVGDQLAGEGGRRAQRRAEVAQRLGGLRRLPAVLSRPVPG